MTAVLALVKALLTVVPIDLNWPPIPLAVVALAPYIELPVDDHQPVPLDIDEQPLAASTAPLRSEAIKRRRAAERAEEICVDTAELQQNEGGLSFIVQTAQKSADRLRWLSEVHES